jgi:hypothetical protein
MDGIKKETKNTIIRWRSSWESESWKKEADNIITVLWFGDCEAMKLDMLHSV